MSDGDTSSETTPPSGDLDLSRALKEGWIATWLHFEVWLAVIVVSSVIACIWKHGTTDSVTSSWGSAPPNHPGADS